MKLKDIKFDFPISKNPYTIELIGIGEVIKCTHNSLYIKTKIIRSFNYTSNIFGISCYKNPLEEVKFEYYPSIIEIHSTKIGQITIIDGKVIFDTSFIDMDFDGIYVFIDIENMHVETFAPIQC